MDALTHAIVGAAVAQLPGSGNTGPGSTNKQTIISWQKRAVIGASAALFADIDYLLFFINPLEFLAYWHRAETHSLLLAPLWAWLIMKCWQRLSAWQLPTKPLYWLCLLAFISHPILDSLTAFGTQWFAPLSRYRVAFNILFVIDAYFTAAVLCSLCLLLISNHLIPNHLRFKFLAVFFAALLPCSYLFMVIQIKHHIGQQISASQQSITLMPQPFSPFYWSALSKSANGFAQAYIRFGNDDIGQWLTTKLGIKQHQASYRLVEQIIWLNYPLIPKQENVESHVLAVWQHRKFKPFRHFSISPIFYDYQHTAQQTCVWFSDLRYHWPNIPPSFRYGMCRQYPLNRANDWQLSRMKYFQAQGTHN
ncbi:hypothetical protein A9Q98_12925 [Thalassotalea sp. 42_200_T64]|nr:hypothetical protein A9Q98_12925 [Thalassotalea sp. 42_200_T64]